MGDTYNVHTIVLVPHDNNNNRAFIRSTISGYPFKGADFLMIGRQSYA